MAVRNWYVKAQAEGAKTMHTLGPESKVGGIDISVYQRHCGGSVLALQVCGQALQDGTLWLSVMDASGNVIHEYKTQR